VSVAHEDKWRLRYSVVLGLAQISRKITLSESLRNTAWRTLQKHLNRETDPRIINAVRIFEVLQFPATTKYIYFKYLHTTLN